MENTEQLLELKVDEPAVNNLNEMSRWAKFLAVSVLIGSVLSFILFFILWDKIAGKLLTSEEFEPARNSRDPYAVDIAIKFAVIIALLVFGAIVGILMSFLIKAANRIRAGIKNNDQMQFNSGLAGLKSYFSMYGVLSIIMLCLSLLALTQINR